MTMAVELATHAKRLLDSLQDSAVAAFLAEWPDAARERAVAADSLPVLRWLPQIAHDPAVFGAELIAALLRAAPALAWRQTYTAKDLDRSFLDNYGWSEIFGRNAGWASERLACGFLFLGPSTHYPLHRHEAEELYLPLSGTAQWRQGDAEWRDRPPGTPIFHASEEPHSMRTGAVPLLALYLWRSASLDQKARLD